MCVGGLGQQKTVLPFAAASHPTGIPGDLHSCSSGGRLLQTQDPQPVSYRTARNTMSVPWPLNPGYLLDYTPLWEVVNLVSDTEKQNVGCKRDPEFTAQAAGAPEGTSSGRRSPGHSHFWE